MLRDAEKTIGSLIDHQKICYLSSVDEDGFPATRAMLAPRAREGICTFYFSTNTSSRKVAEYRQNPRACLYCCDRRFFRGVYLKGRMEVLETPEMKERFWEKGDTQYYPLGVTDPDYCILRFTAENGRYYSAFKNQDFGVAVEE